MKNKKTFIYGGTVGVVLFSVAVSFWLTHYWPGMKTKNLLVSNANQLPLYELGDKAMKVNLKTLDSQTGKWSDLPVTIYQSKSRLNQVKQAVLLFIDYSQELGVPPGLSVNEIYLTPEGNAIVDISTTGLTPSSMGFYDELLFVRGLIETLSKNFPAVRQVKLLVDGQDAPTIAGQYALGTSESAVAVKTPTN